MNNDFIDIFGNFDCMFQSKVHSLAIKGNINLSSFETRVILLISRYTGCSQQAIASWTSRDKAQVARTIKDLEARELLVRTTHRYNGRAQKIELTINGEIACQKIMMYRLEVLSEMFSNIDSNEKEILYSILSKVYSKIIE